MVVGSLVVAFRDGNRRNCDLANLCLLSREDNARRRAKEETPERINNRSNAQY